MPDVKIDVSEHSELNIKGDFGGGNVEKTTKSDDSWRLHAERLSTDFQLLRHKCEATEEKLRREISDLYKQRIEDMKRVMSIGLVSVLLLLAIAFQLFFGSTSEKAGNHSVTAVGESDWVKIASEGYETLPSTAIELSPQEGRHCIYRAVDTPDGKHEGITKEDCFDTVEQAISELAKRTGENYKDLLIAREPESGVSTAVIGVHYACSYYTCGTVTVYAGNSGGCYSGQKWYQPVINYPVGSVLTLGGCNQTTLFSDYFFTGWSLACGNCPTVGGQTKSANYK